MKHKLSNLEGDFERYGSIKKERFLRYQQEKQTRLEQFIRSTVVV
jgi:hypothetical protein